MLFTLVCLITRGVRGQRGVEWLLETLSRNLRIQRLAQVAATLAEIDPAAAAVSLQRMCAALVLLYDVESLLEEEAVPSWGSHQEGLHRIFSGRYFLQAAAFPSGAAGLIKLAVDLQPAFADVAAGRPYDVAAMIRPMLILVFMKTYSKLNVTACNRSKLG